MLYLSQIETKKDSICIKKASIDNNAMHKLVMNLFPDNISSTPCADCAILYCTSIMGDKSVRLVIQSAIKPDISRVNWIEKAQCTAIDKQNLPLSPDNTCCLYVKTIPYKQIVDNRYSETIRDGTHLRKTKKCSIKNEAEKREWLEKRLKKCGATVLGLKMKVDRVCTNIKGYEDKATEFYAKIRVEDIDAFYEECMRKGIGDKKAFGMGLPILF